MALSPDLIPTLTIAIPFLYDGWLWLQYKRAGIHVLHSSYSIFALSLSLQGVLYLFFFFIDIPIQLRGFWVRVSALNIALSFAIPLTMQLKREYTKWTGK